MPFAKRIQGAKGAVVRTLAVAVCGLTLAGCDTLSSLNPFDKSDKYTMDTTPDVPNDQLYNDGLGRLQKGDYDAAAKKFQQLEKQAPYSEWAPKALIMETYTRYQQQQWEDTISTAQRYLQRYPNGKDAAYAQYLMAMSSYNQIPDITRDQEAAAKAMESLQVLVNRYPKSEYVADAKKKIQFAKDQLAGNQMEVGRYYLNNRNYTGAINRFRDVVSQYQQTRHVEEALERLAEAYMALGITNEAQTAAAVLGHNFPDSPWYKDAYKLLQSNGLEPREDRGSWISRSFRGLAGAVGLEG
ncbi:outer membrane protein assembly factor BamD [Microvirga sp. W0021]|uniref:Outer membrane protein assembly factor BamD n=1 Tax=Hohaiivirga grylli TaxID=3133970 RepID=A0ABV0BND1_9HYPH